jgi:pimeloyl-ACP methyl ester carboxylesterase
MILAATGGAAIAAAGGLALYSFLAGVWARWRVPPAGKFITLPDARIHYMTKGSGPPVVLVHGLTGQLQDFSYALVERLALDHHVIVFDRPGSGYSTWRRGGDQGIAAHAKVLRDLLEVLGLLHPLVIGHSLGGAVTLKLAIDYPRAVGALALICPLTQPIAEAPPIFKPLVIPSAAKRGLLSRTLAVPVGQLQRRRILQALFAPDAVPADYVARAGVRLKDRASVFRTASLEVIAAQAEMDGIASRLNQVRVPVSILFGRDDAVLDPMLHGRTPAAVLPHADVTFVDGGHMIPATRARMVADWIGRVASGASAARREASRDHHPAEMRP